MSFLNYQDGTNVEVTAPYDVTAGAGCLVGALFGVAVFDALSGAQVTIVTRGVHQLVKATGAGTDAALGAVIYWDNSAKKVTGVSSGNTKIGCVTVAAGTSDAVATVRLNGTV